MKAIIGGVERRPQQLLAELTALRTRVRELQEELAREREANARLRAIVDGSESDLSLGELEATEAIEHALEEAEELHLKA